MPRAATQYPKEPFVPPANHSFWGKIPHDTRGRWVQVENAGIGVGYDGKLVAYQAELEARMFAASILGVEDMLCTDCGLFGDARIDECMLGHYRHTDSD